MSSAPKRKKKKHKGSRRLLRPDLVFYTVGGFAALSVALVMGVGDRFIALTGVAAVCIVAVLVLNDRRVFAGSMAAERDDTYRRKFRITESVVLFVLLLACILLTAIGLM